MPTYTGSAISTPLIPDYPAYMSPDIQEILADFSEEAALVSRWFGGSFTAAATVTSPQTLTGGYWRGFADIFYNRIFLIPDSFDATSLPDDAVLTMQVWNAYFVSKTLTSINPINIAGFTQGGTSVPTTFNALQIKPFTFTLTDNLVPSFEGKYQFVFSDAEDPFLIISGSRINLFPFIHDWNEDIMERVAYLTDVTEAKSGKEQRRKIRSRPRRQFEYKTLVATEDDPTTNARLRALYHNLMFSWQGKTFILPIWTDVQFLTSDLLAGATSLSINTIGYDFDPDSFLVFWTDPENYELARIDSMTTSSLTFTSPTLKSWKKGVTRVVPGRLGNIGQDIIKSSGITYELENAAQSWNINVKDIPSNNRILTSYTPTYTYKGYEIFTDLHDFSSDPGIEIYRPLRALDYETGIFTLDSRYSGNRERVECVLLLKDRTEISKFFAFFAARSGRWTPVWIPSWSQDFQIVENVSPSNTEIKIKDIGYTKFVAAHPARRDILAVKPNGLLYPRRITDSINNGDGTETITLDTSFGFAITTGITFERVCYLRFCRLDADLVELDWNTDGILQVKLVFTDLINSPE